MYHLYDKNIRKEILVLAFFRLLDISVAHKNGLLKSIRLNGFDQCPYDTFENGTIKQCTDAHGKQ